MTTENPTPQLWAVHAQGPDDIYPAYDRADAERHAAELNALSTPPGISVAAIVIPSPFTKLEHWKYLAEQEREHKLHLISCVAPTDANLSAMRREGLSIDGDNAYKRDLLDVVVGAMAFGFKNTNPPPEGHWGKRFWDIGRAEGEAQEKLFAKLQAQTAQQAEPKCSTCNDVGIVGHSTICPGCEDTWTPPGEQAEPLHVKHRPLIRNAINLLGMRRPVAPDVQRVIADLEAMLEGLPTPADEPRDEWLQVAASAEPVPAQDEQHFDDRAVDRFAAAMKAKMAAARAKGRYGWFNRLQCPGKRLARMLIEHLSKGNEGTFEGIANFCMMLHQRGEDPQLLTDATRAAQTELLEMLRNFTFLHDDECAGALRGHIDRSLAAHPAEAEGAIETGSDAWMALHLLDRLDVSADEEPRVQQVEEIVRRMGAALSAVTAERDVLKKDADRYRWLRNTAMETAGVAPAVLMVDGECKPAFDEPGYGHVSAKSGATLDAAIDAAMAAKEDARHAPLGGDA